MTSCADVLRRKMIRVGMEAEASHDHSKYFCCWRTCLLTDYPVLTSEFASLLAMEFNRNPVVNDEAAFDIYPPCVMRTI